MAKQRTDTEAVINLVINGKQAMTSLSQLTDTQRRLTAEFRHMNELDPQYPRRLRELQAINQAVAQQRDLMRGVQTEAEKVKESWTDIASVAGGNLIADGIQSAIGAVASFVSGSKAAYAEAEQGQAQLQAALKSTGGVSGRTKQQLDALSQSLMNLTGVDDDVITKSESLLLTFTNVRGEIFDQTLPAIVDMTAALNQGNVSMENIQATTLQVGKALNDPIKGMTALRKVGVSFTEEQIKTVKGMVATNDVAGAQKIILAELSKEFGGMGKALAETDTGQEQKMATRLGNIQEALGGLIVKGKSSFVQFFSPLVGWMERVIETKMSETLDQDRISLSANMIQLQASNTSHETRVGIIKKLKEQYPAYLGQIDAEKVSNANLLPVLNEINKALVLKIAFQKKNESLNDAMEDEAEAFLRLDKASTQFSMTLAAIMDRAKDRGMNFIIPKNLTDLQQADFLVKKLNESRRNSSGFNVDMGIKDIKLAALNLTQLKTAYENTSASREKLLNAQTAFATKNGLTPDGNTPTMAKNGQPPVAPPIVSGKSGPSTKEISDAEKARKEFENLNEEYKKLGVQRLADQMSKNQKEIEQEGWKYDELIKKERDFLKKKGVTSDQKAQTLAKIDQIQNDKKEAQNIIAVRQEKEMTESIADLRTKLAGKLETELQKEIDLINKFYDDQERNFSGDEKALSALKLARSKELSEAELREKKRLEEKKREIESQSVTLSGDDKMIKLAKINKQYDDELLALRKSFSDKLLATQEYNDTVAAIEKNRKTAIAGMNTEESDKDSKDKKDALLQSTQSIADAVFTISANNRKRETDMALAELDRQRQAELANKSLTDKQKEAINAKFDQKVKAEKLKAWQADKQAALTQAIINGALTVTKLLATPWAAVAAGIAAAAQIAVIASTKPPEFGGGVRDFEGGTAIVGERGLELVEENDKMWLATKASLTNLSPGANVYTASDTSRMLRGKSLSEQMYPASSYSIDSSLARSAEKYYRSTGTNFNNVSSDINQDTATQNATIQKIFDNMTAKMDDMITAQNNANDKKVNLVFSEFEDFQKNIQAVRISQGG